MAEEIELKLALPEEAQRTFLRHPLLRQATHKQAYRLTNLYYDTPALDLRKRGIALRLRAQGKFWLQSVKCAGNRAGGLSARPEWETPYGGHFDFAAIDDPKVRAWLERPKLANRIAPIFETNFQRTAWTFELVRGTRIELALDRGWIAAGGQREAISEVEIELLEGNPAELFNLAQALAARAPLVLAPLSKADRGYRLFRQIPATPFRAEPIPLASTDTPAEAFRSIALACLDHLQRNHAGAINSEDPEYIHQMRVAVRRLRAALRLFEPLLPEGFAAQLLPALRELMAMLGAARDYDVLLAEIAEPVLRALPDEPRLAALVGVITERRFAIRRDALQRLAAPHYGEVVLNTLATLHGLDTIVGAGGTAAEEAESASPTLLDYAEIQLRHLRKKTLALAAQASVDAPETLHALRIGIKRLRYALEFFAPLAARKPMQRLIEHLVELQDALGQINDLANAGALLMDCADEDQRLREAVTLIGGWHGPRHQKLLAAVPRGLKRLGKLRLPGFRA
ncbi:MAG: CHAD domain-containing protein [Pseudomonadota bacterium]